MVYVPMIELQEELVVWYVVPLDDKTIFRHPLMRIFVLVSFLMVMLVLPMIVMGMDCVKVESVLV